MKQRERTAIEELIPSLSEDLSTRSYVALTLAGLHALKPPMLHVSILSASAVLVPSTAGSATTDSAGFLERAACWARHLISNRRGDG